MHKWLGITHSDSEPDESSSGEEDIFTDTFDRERVERAKQYADNIAARPWGLSHRDSAGLSDGRLKLTDDLNVVFQEELGQQRRVWDCALVLSKFLTHSEYFPPGFFQGKRVIELGCGIGVPGLSAARLGAKQVVLTDMDLAVPWIQVNIAKNNLSDTVEAMGLMWGPDSCTKAGGPFDIILCSDLIYGDTELALLLISTISQLSYPSTVVIFAHEARYAGNQGRFFLDEIASSHDVDPVPFDLLDTTYRSTNIFVHLIRQRNK
ncbi:unnamed protein product [Aphanomyces euteiches]|uniref:Uncharacterized protein n=1 Tax=Aphanomyces euteiches TaxID=100861 RepID=A0A6G0XV44_9STRA|nr:hypothetical protein Ae201684_000807 [Aphanomyces euteiches]KAH9099530.1 hypothetical protein Ae201684P_018543 [Aphanomyces euteiches]KAH9135792.1 hypothetical protein AeRB84_018878 [Aphanomyces euteiches]